MVEVAGCVALLVVALAMGGFWIVFRTIVFPAPSTSQEVSFWRSTAFRESHNCDERLHSMKMECEEKIHQLERLVGHLHLELIEMRDAQTVLPENSPKTALRKKILDLGYTEFKKILFDLELPDAEVEGENLPENVIWLLRYCKRHGLMPRLMAYLSENYKAISWS